MKECDKWSKKEFLPSSYFELGSVTKGSVTNEILFQRRRAWRAALEWVDKMRTDPNMSYELLFINLEEELEGELK